MWSMEFHALQSWCHRCNNHFDIKGIPYIFSKVRISTSYEASMGLVYLPTFTIKRNPNVGKYTSPMDSIGIDE